MLSESSGGKGKVFWFGAGMDFIVTLSAKPAPVGNSSWSRGHQQQMHTYLYQSVPAVVLGMVLSHPRGVQGGGALGKDWGKRGRTR